MEGLHAVGDIITKISVNCVLNYMLHYYLCVYFYGFSCVWFIPIFIFMGISCLCCMYMFTVISSMNLCITECICLFYVLYIKFRKSFCVYMF
jgi:hypothetical protein